MTSSADGSTVQPLDAVVEAMRALLWVETSADARRTAERLVRQLGGTVVSARGHDAGGLPADISFGNGEPLIAVAPAGSDARAHLEMHLVPFLMDARRALQLSGRLERLDEEASTDRLTTLPNRRTVERALGRMDAGATVIMLDLDHFKRVNDEFGHHMGDEVLSAFGTALRSVVRGSDLAGRFGGEEFVAIVSSPEGATSLLERLRAKWESSRPLPITFSAGIARSVGDATTTLRLADAALYRAKEAGRDQWEWSQSDDRLGEATNVAPSQFVDRYVADAVGGARSSAIRTTLDMYDGGVSEHRVILELLAAGQREVGERWHRNQLSVADEHIATGVSAAALDALVSEVRRPAGDGHTIVVCAEGDWHSLAAQMFGESLRGFGFGVTVLGASTPAPYVAELLNRRNADSLAISCSLPIHYPGVIRLIDIARVVGVPVIVGGRAFGADGERAARLGADAWALTAEQAAAILRQWRLEGPPIPRLSAPPDPRALHMLEHAADIARAASPALLAAFPPMATFTEDQLARTSEDLAFNVQFLAAAGLVRDDTVYTGFLEWLKNLLASRGVPRTALPAGLEALRPIVDHEYPEMIRLLDLGHRQVTAD